MSTSVGTTNHKQDRIWEYNDISLLRKRKETIKDVRQIRQAFRPLVPEQLGRLDSSLDAAGRAGPSLLRRASRTRHRSSRTFRRLTVGAPRVPPDYREGRPSCDGPRAS